MKYSTSNYTVALKPGSRSLTMSPFDRAHMTSYWRSV